MQRTPAVSTDTQSETTSQDEVTSGTETEKNEKETIIGTSVGGRDITAYHFGTGDTDILFVGGIHGGYSWNTPLVAYEAIDYFTENQSVIPENVRVTVIPVLNPDGLYVVAGTAERFTEDNIPSNVEETITGRFNANAVDLNRNFDCEWQSTGTWQSTTVDGGSKAFSEPESEALRAYVEGNMPEAVVAWYSAAGGVFASSCRNGVLEETNTLTNLYADASGYKAYEEFDFYKITGDMVNWFAKNEVPAISVLLSTHDTIEWSKNKKGIDALLNHYAQ